MLGHWGFRVLLRCRSYASSNNAMLPGPPMSALPTLPIIDNTIDKTIDKAQLRAALLQQLAAALGAAKQAHQAAVEGATHSEARAENSKDTRGLEQSYIARGQAQRIVELEAASAAIAGLPLDSHSPGPIRLGSVVRAVRNQQLETLYWLVPAGGGTTIDGVLVVTPQSPIGRELLRSNDAADLDDDLDDLADGNHGHGSRPAANRLRIIAVH